MALPRGARTGPRSRAAVSKDSGSYFTLRSVMSPSRYPQSAHRHRYDILFAAIRWNRVDAGRMRQDFAFARQGGGGNLRHHEAGIDSGVGREKGRQPLIEIGMDQPVDATLGHRR